MTLLAQLAFTSKADLTKKGSRIAIDQDFAAELIQTHVQIGFEKPGKLAGP